MNTSPLNADANDHPASAAAAGSVVLVQSENDAHHFLGVEQRLDQRGLRCFWLYAGQPPVRLGPEIRAVVVKDCAAPISRFALRQAARQGVPTVLLMDGIVEWRNTFRNPSVGEDFLRPAPVDVVACAGEMDAVTLRAMGNEAVATGLPRLAAITRRRARPAGAAKTVLVATANTPAFDASERERVLGALVAVKGVCQRRGVGVIWRLTGGLELSLGVDNDLRPLGDVLRDVDGAFTTPSTLLIETMLAGVPTCLMDLHPCPCWQAAAWIWKPCGEESAVKAGEGKGWSLAGLHQGLRAGARIEARVEDILDDLTAPSAGRLERQEQMLNVMHSQSRPAAQTLVDLCVELAERPRSKSRRVTPAALRMPAPAPARPGVRRVLNMVYCDGSPVGGVRTWAERLARAFQEQDLGYDVRTLLIAPQPEALPDSTDELVGQCVFDPTADHFEILRTVRRAAEFYEPDVVLPNYSDLSYMVAQQLQRRGSRVLAVAHTDDAYYQSLMATYNRWDGCVGVSGACAAWLRPLAQDRPTDQIVYGVPVAAAPRTPEASGPLKLLYCGRMVQEQKRIFDLLEVIDGLEASGVAYELNMVGDGGDLPAWKTALAKRSLTSGKVLLHGRREPAWVQEFLSQVDVSVLVSDYEGTSISMLEAMGQGVVPVVTRVSSGVDEWIRDGHNGLTVPLRSPGIMAQRLAVLAADRAKIASLGREAWATARAGSGIDGMAAAYRRMFDRVMQRPIDESPSDLGVRITEPHRWMKVCTEDPAGAESWLHAALREGGYRHIALDRPTPGCDAVLVRTDQAPVGLETAEQWRSAGLGVAFSPHVCREAYGGAFDRTLRAAVRAGATRIALFGAGRHTRAMAPFFHMGYPIVGIIDDTPPAGGRLFGTPVVPLERAAAMLKPDAVVLSSDAWEAQMWERSAGLRREGVRVWPVYGVYEDQAAGTIELSAPQAVLPAA